MRAFKQLAVLTIFLLASFSGKAQAISLDNLVNGGSISVHGNQFTDWLIFTSSSLTPNLEEIEVLPLDDDPLNPGLQFLFGNQVQFTATGDLQSQFFDFGFTVSTVSGEPMIQDNSLSLTGHRFSEDPEGEEFLNVFEDVWDAGFDNILGEKQVTADKLFPENNVFFDMAEFSPQSTINVDIFTDLNTLAAGDFVSLDSLEMRFSQVPEPSTLVLLGSGFGLLCLWGQRRRVK